LIVIYQSRRELRNANPKPENLRVVVEISDSTYDLDRTVKAGLYARAGIREFWVVDIRNVAAPRRILHLSPSEGRYETAAYPHDVDVTVLDRLKIRLSELM
jgi:Uma2 family endonuclease